MTAATVTAPGTAPAPRRAPLGRVLRSELRWVFRRPRTIIAIALLAITPIAIGVGTLFAEGGVNEQGESPMVSMAINNALALPIVSLGMMMVFLLPLVSSMSAADAIAGEAANGTLRGLMLAPVSRTRLLGVKAFGVAAVTLATTVLMAVIGLITGLLINGTNTMITLSGTTLSFGDAVGRIGFAVVWVTVQMLAVAAVALAVSTTTEHPMVVMAAVMGGLIVFGILGTISALDWLHPVLLSDSWESLPDLLRDPISWGGMGEGLIRAGCYIAIGYSLALARMSTKDG
ncbi:ABC-2 type transport system permease protein [Herbihabitans rhizosphaerae]|uniref:ABC-2 type transport system permease protein n=1 Tax=Herbihabitans rhizosphaerae TaxID=1872711 RepID=A0A4Q7L6Y1_9PSEU|nr:ABC transporter permease subunit [Herbihabitans rhizosphaerae]RZS44371.1 ABC-2 type transport system permease protein [Herbihabitans rhizosphaerae]